MDTKCIKPGSNPIKDTRCQYLMANCDALRLSLKSLITMFLVFTISLTCFAGNKRPIRLFNGKDLSGWGYREKVQGSFNFEALDGKAFSKDGRYKAEEGMLTINPWDESKGPHWINLWHQEEFAGDFILTLEFRASPNADSGIFLRGKQLQCRDYLVAGPYKELKKYKPQDWNKIEVVVKNNIALCTCNGEVLEKALKIPESGSIGLEADRGRMDYRKIRLKKL